MRVLLSICLLVLLTGCATRPCPEDWVATGRADGASGNELRRFDLHARACTREGLATDADGYRRGWDAGNAAFCVRATGVSQGSAGSGPTPACEGRRAYLDGWADGIERHCTAERGQAAGSAGQAANPHCGGRNAGAYTAGHFAGLSAFCSSENGWQAGWRGATNSGACGGVNADAFSRGHRLGSSARDTQREIDELQRDIAKAGTELAATADPARRELLSQRLREHNRDLRALREQLTRLQVAR